MGMVAIILKKVKGKNANFGPNSHSLIPHCFCPTRLFSALLFKVVVMMDLGPVQH